MIGALTNHLWQSTLFVLAAWLVTTALRRNGAHVRHRIWFIASLKFLVPFSILMSLGSALPSFAPAATTMAAPSAADLSITVDRIAEPFTSDAFISTPASSSAATTNWTAVVLGLWACGLVVVVVMRGREWRRIRAAVRAASPMPLEVVAAGLEPCGLSGGLPAPVFRGKPAGYDSTLQVRSSPGLLEPGVVGLFRPVLLVPAGIQHQLTSKQLEAVLAHELCHVSRRDNLTSVIHMVVEAAFWFHPLVWFVGARLVDERERACDEYVLRVCGEPQTYAESILNVCKLYVESPIACVSGVGGADLRKRVAAILINRVGLQLTLARKVTLTTTAMLVILLPLVAGILIAPLHAGQTTARRFDVVSIKPCDPNAPPSSGGSALPPGMRRGGAPYQAQVSPGYAHWECVALTDLIDLAYADRDHPLLNVVDRPRQDLLNQPKRVRGGPSWTATDTFTIEAKAPLDVTNAGLAGSASRYLATLPAEMGQALRATLEDRFKTKVHRATEQQTMYALTIAKGGLNRQTMRAPTAGDCLTPAEYSAAASAGQVSRTNDPAICGRFFVARDGTETYSSFTLPQLARSLSNVLDNYVLDRTGDESTFNFTIKAEPAESGTPGDASRFSRTLEALGLKLESMKGPAEFLVIDSAEKPRPNPPAPIAPDGRGFGEASAAPARAAGAGSR